MTIKEKIEHLSQKRYNRARELVDTEAWYATEYIIELEDELKLQKTLVRELRKLKNK